MASSERVLYLSRGKPASSNPIHISVYEIVQNLGIDIDIQYVEDLNTPIPTWLTVTPTLAEVSEDGLLVLQTDAAKSKLHFIALNSLQTESSKNNSNDIDEQVQHLLAARSTR
jgi:hypothetical protein